MGMGILDGGTFPSHTKNIPSLAVLFSPIIRKLSLFILYGVSLENCADRFMNMAVFFVLLPPPPSHRSVLKYAWIVWVVDVKCMKCFMEWYVCVCARMRTFACMCLGDSESVRDLMLMLRPVALLSHTICSNLPHISRTQILKLCSNHRHLYERIQPSREKGHP